jgi:hypothetical protein
VPGLRSTLKKPDGFPVISSLETFSAGLEIHFVHKSVLRIQFCIKRLRTILFNVVEVARELIAHTLELIMTGGQPLSYR